MKQAPSHRIVIAGGGTGGLELAVRLTRAGQHDVLLIDRDETHVWKPRLHELAAGLDNRINTVDYAGIAETWGFAFHQGELIDVDPQARRVTLAAVKNDHDRTLVPKRALSYEVLVLALGGVTPDLGVDGVLEHALLLDSQWDARAIFQRLSAGLLAQALEREHGEPFHIVIVGSGATGVELAAHFATDYVCRALAPAAHLPEVRITILEAADTFMPGMDDSMRKQVTRRLEAAGVRVHIGRQVSKVRAGSVMTADGGEFPAHLTIWATGRVGPPAAGQIKTLSTNKKRQWTVNKTLQSTASNAIFAMGDCAFIETAPVPPTAQVASEQAQYLASALPLFLHGQPLQAFEHHDKGTLLSLGAAGTLGKVRALCGKDWAIDGYLAQTAYRRLQRQHQYVLLGVRKGSMRILGDMIGRKAGPSLKVLWRKNKPKQ